MSQKNIDILIFLSLFVLCFAIAFLHQPNNDIWGHALYGKVLWQQGHFLTFSEYSCVQGEDARESFDYGFRIIAYLSYHYFGIMGLALLKAFLTGLVIVFVHLWLKEMGGSFAITGIAVFWIAVISYTRFLVRGDFFTLAFLAITLFAIAHYLRTGSKKIYGLLPLQILWVNIHGLWLLAPLVVGAFSIEKLILYKKHQDNFKKFRELLFLSVLLFVFSLFNPGGYHKLLLPLLNILGIFGIKVSGVDVLKDKIIYQNVGEFLPLFSFPLFPSGAFYLLLAFFVFVTVIKFWNKISLGWLAIAIIFFLGGLRFVRLLGIFAIVAAPVVCFYLWRWLSLQNNKSCGYLAIVLNSLLSIALISNFFSKTINPYPSIWSVNLPNVIMPVKAVAYLKKQKLSGNIFHTYDQGGYIAFHLYPKIKIFHSSLTDYTYKHFQLSHQIRSGKIDFSLFLTSFKIDLILLPHGKKNLSTKIRHLYFSKKWLVIYLDEAHIVFIRYDLWKKHLVFSLDVPILLDDPEVKNSWQSLGQLGNIYYLLGKEQQAQLYYQKTLKMYPQAAILNNLAAIQIRHKQYLKALEYLIQAIKIEPQKTYYHNLKIAIKNLSSQDKQKAQILLKKLEVKNE